GGRRGSGAIRKPKTSKGMCRGIAQAANTASQRDHQEVAMGNWGHGFKGQVLQSRTSVVFKTVQPSADGRVMDAQLLGNLPQPLPVLAIGNANLLRRPALEQVG